MNYVNHLAMRDAFAPLRAEVNPVTRAALLDAISEDFLTQFEEEMERTAYELRRDGWTLQQVANELMVGQARIKTMVANHARRIKRKNPIRSGREHENAVDISHLVRRRKRMRRKG